MRRELAGEKRVSGTLTDERNALKEKVQALERETAATKSEVMMTKDALDKMTEKEAAALEQGKQSHLKFSEVQIKLTQVSKDADKLRTRLESKDELARTAQADNDQLQVKLEELLSESGRKERALTVARSQALEEKQKVIELEQNVAWLTEAKGRFEGMVTKRDAEIHELNMRATTAENAAKMLAQKLNNLGAKDAEASLELRPLKEAQQQAGVFDPLAQLPNVPVLGNLCDVIGKAEGDIKALTAAGGQLASMAQVDVLKIDQTLPPDEGQLYSKEPVPLPYPPVLMRQFEPPPEDLPPPSPPPPEESGVFTGKKAESGAGQVVLPPESGRPSSRQRPDQS